MIPPLIIVLKMIKQPALKTELFIEIDYLISKYGKQISKPLWGNLIQILYESNDLNSKVDEKGMKQIIKVLKLVLGDYIKFLEQDHIDMLVGCLIKYQSLSSSVNDSLTLQNLFWNIVNLNQQNLTVKIISYLLDQST